MRERLGYVRRDSWIHRLNPVLKLVLLVLVLVSILLYPSWKFSALLLIITLISFNVAHVSLKLARRRTQFVIIFSLAIILFQIVTTSNGVVLGFIIPRVNEWGPFLPITVFGLEKGLAFVTRFLLVILSSMLFVSVTDPNLLSHSLTRIGIPYRYTFALVIALRFLPLFDSENEVVRKAQQSRGISPSMRGLKSIIRTVQYTFFPLLISALSRVDSLSLSMEGRGFGFQKERTYFRKSEWRRCDSFILLLGVALLILSFLLSSGYLPQISAIL